MALALRNKCLWFSLSDFSWSLASGLRETRTTSPPSFRRDWGNEQDPGERENPVGSQGRTDSRINGDGQRKEEMGNSLGKGWKRDTGVAWSMGREATTAGKMVGASGQPKLGESQDVRWHCCSITGEGTDGPGLGWNVVFRAMGRAGGGWGRKVGRVPRTWQLYPFFLPSQPWFFSIPPFGTPSHPTRIPLRSYPCREPEGLEGLIGRLRKKSVKCIFLCPRSQSSCPGHTWSWG